MEFSRYMSVLKTQCDDLRIDLKELLAYPLTPVPYSIATLEGFLNKADKSKGYHFLTKDVEDVPPLPNDKKLVIEDHHIVNEQEAEMQCYIVGDIR
jgi:hypothetical protein